MPCLVARWPTELPSLPVWVNLPILDMSSLCLFAAVLKGLLPLKAGAPAFDRSALVSLGLHLDGIADLARFAALLLQAHGAGSAEHLCVPAACLAKAHVPVPAVQDVPPVPIAVHPST